jgi:hypothetical protein
MTRTERPAVLRAATRASLCGWPDPEFARHTGSLLGRSILFAGSMGCLLAGFAMLLRLF